MPGRLGTWRLKLGAVKSSNSTFVDDFNQLVMNAFNLASGNMLASGNVLAWNVWFRAPELVNQTEWKEHAEKWRHSIDVDHKAPTGSGTIPRYFDGKPFTIEDAMIEEAIQDIIKFITHHLFHSHHPMVH